MSNPHIRSDDTFRLTESTNVTNLADEVFSENEEFSPACIDLDRVENFPGENEERSSMNCWLHAIEGIDKDGTKPSITASTASNSTFNLGKNHNRKSQLDHIGVAQSECESPFSSSQVEFILAEQAKVAHNDSSISLVDLDAMDDENFLNPSLVPAKLEVANLLGEATGTGLMF
uniref:Uncharacterized protein n=1 Tax=Ciona savignyi TaxID=51511 RepID=H2YUG7_CIOSA